MRIKLGKHLFQLQSIYFKLIPFLIMIFRFVGKKSLEF